MQDLFKSVTPNMPKYCLDTNIFIEAWNKYYSMVRCPDYWNILDNLAQDETVFSTEEVKNEIVKADDALADWVKSRDYFFKDISIDVQKNLRCIMRDFPLLVNSQSGRSGADPWVIAHAMTENATVVTKEELTNSTKRYRIPDVCKHYGMKCITDFQFIDELKIVFNANRQVDNK